VAPSPWARMVRGAAGPAQPTGRPA
jgi:hypothetical protein